MACTSRAGLTAGGTGALERALRIYGQAQYADHDDQHDRQCQSRSHSWILGHARSSFGLTP
jgi:hypothetical protein